MRTSKHLISLLLVIAITCTLVVIPASALEPEMIALFRGFDLTTKQNYQTGYTKLVQRFMQTTNHSSCIDDHGGVDGIFGDGTFQAVKLFQRDVGLSANGNVDGNTWAVMANSMQEESLYFVRGLSSYIGRYNNNNRTLYFYQVSAYGQTGTFVCSRTV